MLNVIDHGDRTEDRTDDTEYSVHRVISRDALLDKAQSVDQHAQAQCEQLEKGSMYLGGRFPTSLEASLLAMDHEECTDRS